MPGKVLRWRKELHWRPDDECKDRYRYSLSRVPAVAALPAALRAQIVARCYPRAPPPPGVSRKRSGSAKVGPSPVPEEGDYEVIPLLKESHELARRPLEELEGMGVKVTRCPPGGRRRWEKDIGPPVVMARGPVVRRKR